MTAQNMSKRENILRSKNKIITPQNITVSKTMKSQVIKKLTTKPILKSKIMKIQNNIMGYNITNMTCATKNFTWRTTRQPQQKQAT